jgi:hypothetical protein
VHENRARTFAYPSALSAEDAAYLSGLFSDDIAAVESFLGRSIPEWKSAMQGRP